MLGWWKMDEGIRRKTKEGSVKCVSGFETRRSGRSGSVNVSIWILEGCYHFTGFPSPTNSHVGRCFWAARWNDKQPSSLLLFSYHLTSIVTRLDAAWCFKLLWWLTQLWGRGFYARMHSHSNIVISYFCTEACKQHAYHNQLMIINVYAIYLLHMFCMTDMTVQQRHTFPELVSKLGQRPRRRHGRSKFGRKAASWEKRSEECGEGGEGIKMDKGLQTRLSL